MSETVDGAPPPTTVPTAETDAPATGTAAGDGAADGDGASVGDGTSGRTSISATGPAGRTGPVERPFTLAFDIGGTGLKASVLDARGEMVAERVKVPTTYPMPPTGATGLVPTLVRLAEKLPEADRVSAGFPGMVRNGVILSAPHFITLHGPGSEVDTDLATEWRSFRLGEALSQALDKPARVGNDADVQGLAVVTGAGLELVVTLGTGMGTAVFLDGQLLPHLEIGHQPFRKGESYDEQIGERARKSVGDERWNRRVRKAIVNLEALFFYDHLHIGGGNGRRLSRDALGELLDKITIVDNTAGILGGVKLWSGKHLGV
jgi:polyphosphate glucokinase